MRISHHYYIDTTFHIPKDFSQLLIFMYKDLLTELKIPRLFILMNGKFKIYYDIIFSSIISILTLENKYVSNIETIVADEERELINEKYFPYSRVISYFFRYKQDLLLNIRKYELYDNSQKSTSNLIIKILSDFPFYYKVYYNIIYLNYIIEKYPKYNNFINNYFIKYIISSFKNLSLDYYSIPYDCHTNNYLDN